MRRHLPDGPAAPGPALVVTAIVGVGLAVGFAASSAPPPELPLTVPDSVSAPAPAERPVDVTGLERVSDDTASTQAAPTTPGPRAAASWVASTAASTGIPVVALAAYADATLAVQLEDPACGLGWTTLAAVGAVESGHGSHGGALLGEDGRPSVPIVGPALDGYGVAAIPATPAGTAMHGDTDWEHAVGPLQFLPSTWERWGGDGDGDGASDPHDIDDAALAAAHYLCAGDRDLTSADGWRAAVLSYNRSTAYAADVLELADTYAAAASP